MPKDMLAEPQATAVESTHALPTFEPRWWHSANKLDARPMIWSLYNRPQDWEFIPVGYPFFRHKPSGHSFYASRMDSPSPIAKYRLANSEGCSCAMTTKRYQRFQSWFVGRAYHHWRKTYWNPTHVHPAQEKVRNQFAAHFVR